jgi:hypothetical protein
MNRGCFGLGELTQAQTPHNQNISISEAPSLNSLGGFDERGWLSGGFDRHSQRNSLVGMNLQQIVSDAEAAHTV